MLSSRARYAIRALLEMSLRHPSGPILIQEIAETQKIPLKYLQKILFDLKQAGILVSRKGPGGGYTLAREPEKITLAQVLDAMDGPSVDFCGSGTGVECGCPRPDSCSIRQSLARIAESMHQGLGKATFAELRDAQRKLDGTEANFSDFVI